MQFPLTHPSSASAMSFLWQRNRLPFARRSYSSCVVHNKLYVLGRVNRGSGSSDCTMSLKYYGSKFVQYSFGLSLSWYARSPFLLLVQQTRIKTVFTAQNTFNEISQSENQLVLNNGTPGATRTHDTRFRKPLLYPLSYRGTASLQLYECKRPL